MTTANVNVTKVLLKRGNTAQNNNYTGVSGELTIDTQLKTLRVHDGVTAGGNAITASGAIGSYSNTNTAAYLASQSITSANIGAFQTFANANAATQATSINTVNANIGAYQTFANSNAATQTTSIDSINANVGAYQTYANSNAATQTTGISTVNANVTAANSAIQSLSANIGTLVAGAPGALDTLIELGNALGNSSSFSSTVVNWLGNITSNVTAANSRITTLDANLGTATTNITTLFTNAATQATGINTINANLGAYQTFANANAATQATSINSIDANIGAYQTYANSNAATQTTSIDSINANVGAYQTFANSNAATQATSINSIDANVGAYQTFANSNAATQATSINTVNANIGAYQTYANSNAATQSTAIATLQTQVYGNASVAAYLTTATITTTGNITAGNVAGETFTGNLVGRVLTAIQASITTLGTLTNVNTSGNVNVTNTVNTGALIALGNITAGNVSANQYNFANGVNILSTVGAGAYGNTQVATYLSNYNGDINFTSSTAIISNVDVITVMDNIQSPAYRFSNGVNILSTVANTYLPTYSGNVSAVNFVGAIQAQVGSSFAYSLNAFGAGSDTGGVFLPADINSNAVVAGYTIVSNAGVTLTVTSASFVAGTPNFVTVATTPTASSFLYPATVYSDNYSPALPTSTITVGNATAGNISVAGRVTFVDATYQTTAWTGVANTYVALGTGAGGATQSQTAVAIGVNAGNVAQDYYTVAIGIGAGRDTQLAGAIAIGAEAGGNSQGTYGIAIGFRAGRTNQASNTIILNATGANLNATTANTLTVAPIRNTTGTDGLLQYNNTTKEVSYSSTLGSNLTVTGNVVQNSAYYETYANVTNSGGNLTCNFNLGTTFYATLGANVTANFTNVNAIASTVSGATIIVDQGATAYRVANVQVNGVNQTVKWVGATTGTGTASNTDVMSFSLIHLGGGAYRVLGQISNYG